MINLFKLLLLLSASENFGNYADCESALEQLLKGPIKVLNFYFEVIFQKADIRPYVWGIISYFPYLYLDSIIMWLTFT